MVPPPDRRSLPVRSHCVLLVLLATAGCGDAVGPIGGLAPPASGALAVGVSGLPPGIPADITVSGPGGFTQTLHGPATLPKLPLGTYAIRSRAVGAEGHTWEPKQVEILATVSPEAEATAGVEYALATGALTVTVSGLPLGTAAGLTLQTETWSARFDESMTWSGLPPGTYLVTGGPVGVGSALYEPILPQSFEIAADTIPVEIGVDFGRRFVTVSVTVSGLPEGAAADLTLMGPGGMEVSVMESGVLDSLDPGVYRLAADPVAAAGNLWDPSPALIEVVVDTGTATFEVAYTRITGDLIVEIEGLDAGLGASVRVTGPSDFLDSLAGTKAIPGLAPGTYVVAAQAVSSGEQVYQPAPPSQTVEVTADSTPTVARVEYAPSLGWLSVSVWGLPSGLSPVIRITGPNGFTEQVGSGTTFGGLQPGIYLITADSVSNGGQNYAPISPTHAVSVVAGATSAVSVVYFRTTGDLAVTIGGLPDATPAAVAVTGPGGFTANLTESVMLSGLVPGAYTVSASVVSESGEAYGPNPASQQIQVAAGTTVGASVHYTLLPGGASLNLWIDGLYLTQATQRYDGSVPLVAGRDAYLRVFALANESNAEAPSVRVRLYNGASLLQTHTLSAPTGSVPAGVDQSQLTASWNILIPAALVQPGLAVLADVDPDDTVVEALEGDNMFPAAGTPMPIDVRALPTFDVRFVPVLQQANGLQGNITSANAGQFLADAQRWLPVASPVHEVRAPYTTTAPVLQSNDANGAWGTILSEILALKAADGSNQYYYGVVQTNYSSGIAGLGYVGGSARTGIGWDRLPSGGQVMAHELGHNMGRWHAPCGGAGNPDPTFPWAGGSIGVWGLDVASLTLKDPLTYFDFMGYCNPDWVSDHNWSGMVAYRQAGPHNLPAAASGRGLLVWGRITSRGPVLEPAFVVDAVSTPPAPGPYRLEAIGTDGTVLAVRTFAPIAVADGPEAEMAFAFVLPLERVLEFELDRLRVTGPGGGDERRTTGAGEPMTQVERTATGGAVLRWDTTRYPMVMIRDRATGAVLSFARGGRFVIPAGVGAVHLTYTDGVRSRLEERILR